MHLKKEIKKKQNIENNNNNFLIDETKVSAMFWLE
jgi:hypothetical protein